MATTYNEYVGTGDGVNGSTSLFSFTFEYLDEAHVKASINGANTTDFTLANATQVSFNTPPTSGATVRIYRDTSADNLEATFFPGSAIRAQDLNDNFNQSIYIAQENVVKVDENKTSVDSALSTAQSAVTTANSAVSSANTANTTAASAVTTANTADGKADTAIADAASAQTAATNASASATAASTSATAAQAAATATQATAGALASEFTINSGTIEVESPLSVENGAKLPVDVSSYQVEGAIRYNSTLDKIELYNGSTWNTAAGGATIGASPPSPASSGDVWYDHDDGRAYVYYNDGDSSQWVEMNPSWNGSVADNSVTEVKLDIHNAPSTGKVLSYTSNGLEWTTPVDTGLVSGDNISELNNDAGYVTTDTNTQLAFANDANNRIVTGDGSGGLNGEANLTFDGSNLEVNGSPPWSVTGGDYRNLSISGDIANSGGFLWLGNGAAATNGGHDLARVNICNGVNIVSQIAGTTDTSANDDGRLSFHTKATGGSLTERLRIGSNGNVGIGVTNPRTNLDLGAGQLSFSHRSDYSIRFYNGEGNNWSSINNPVTADGSTNSELNLSSASGVALKLSNSGYVTKPKQPYGKLHFNSYSQGGASGNTLQQQDSVHTSTVRNGITHNNSGRLTVPIDGTYLICNYNNIKEGNDAYMQTEVNGSSILGGNAQNNDTGDHWKSMGISIIMDLSANDYIESVIRGDADGPNWNSLSVTLIS